MLGACGRCLPLAFIFACFLRPFSDCRLLHGGWGLLAGICMRVCAVTHVHSCADNYGSTVFPVRLYMYSYSS
eukprot:COSAG01_NODE_4606_length_4884_cov_3.073981_9_plen_72_part_00